MSQVRIGWRSIYDTSGRLTQMNYYKNGLNVADSNYFFQYYTDNVVKGVVRGEISREQKCRNGSIMLLNESESLTSYNVTRGGQTVFSSICEDLGTCTTTWGDTFDGITNCWEGDSLIVENSELTIYNKKSFSVALYNPPIPISITNDFVIQTKIPKVNNSSRLGLIIGWKDPLNFIMLEILSGEYYTLISFDDGTLKQIGETRIPIGKKGETVNEIKIRRSNTNLIFEINQNIEMIIPVPVLEGDRVGFINRSRGKARFQDFVFQYLNPANDPTISTSWIGKGTGFFITPTGKIITTYDAISDAKHIRVKGFHNGSSYTLSANLVRVEEEQNLAILQIVDDSFIPFKELPYGYSSTKPVSESAVFSIGFPNAVSGVVINPELFSGKILPSSSSPSTTLTLEMSFRYGMIGAPIFDSNVNLIGVVANKGMELKYTEGVDFFRNARLFQGYMSHSERSLESPLKRLNQQEQIKALSEAVVIIESSIFDFQDKN
jgi:hypothetical protein